MIVDKIWILGGETSGESMSLHMVDADQGFVQGSGQGFSGIETDAKTVGETWTAGDGDEIDGLDALFAEVGLLDRLLYDRG